MRKSGVHLNNITIDKKYIEQKHGILNALCFASGEYISKVLKKHGDQKVKRFSSKDLGNLQRVIVHKHPHLDEYFAELLFRSILPYNLKDIELVEHTLMSIDNDPLSQITWPNAVIFGFNNQESGGSRAIEYFDEHEEDGSRRTPSCGQIVADRYLFNPLPKSIQTILDEVNQIDSIGRAHSYNIANLIKKIHDTPYIVGYNDIEEKFTSKYLTENWKRAIVDACITAMIYVYENKLLSYRISKDEEDKLNSYASNSIETFLKNTLLSDYEKDFYKTKAKIRQNFKPGNKTLLKTKSWLKEGENIEQNLVIHKLCYALERCWGHSIATFVMSHLWQAEFQFQISFGHIQEEIKKLHYPETETISNFGSIQILEIETPDIAPFQKESDRVKKHFKENQPIRIIYGSLSNPKYSNLATVLKNIVSKKYQGYGLILLKDKMLNITMVSAGSTVPYKFWKFISDSIIEEEPNRWFQLIAKGEYASFILNRTQSHQEDLPTEIVDLDFLKTLVVKYSR